MLDNATISNLTWDKFLSDAVEVVNISKKIQDNWVLKGDTTIPGRAYLSKSVILPNKHEPLMPLRWEFHICYSISYSVPVIYFNVWHNTGTKLTLDEVWRHCDTLQNRYDPGEMYTVLTQQEHLLLPQLSYVIHPCKTHEILFPVESNSNVVIKFISAVGSMVNLSMDLEYGIR